MITGGTVPSVAVSEAETENEELNSI